MRLCEYEGCYRPHHAKGYCQRHHTRWIRGLSMDSFMRVVGDDEARWRSKVAFGPDCWFWQGTVNRGGYGTFRVGSKNWLAHRWGYQRWAGEIDGSELDHLCRVTRCVRPSHLEPVGAAENSRRRVLYKTSCKQGHEFTPENTAWIQGCRRCRTCSRERNRARRAKR